MSATGAKVIPLFAACDPRGTATCGCTFQRTCYSHQVLAAAELLRSLPDRLDGDAWVMRGDVRRLVADVLAGLDTITAETLPTVQPEPEGARP